MSVAERISPFVGRLLIAWLFLGEVRFRLEDWEGTVGLMHMRHIPDANLLLAIALIVMLLGGLALLLGYHTRQGALLLFGFTILATVFMHDYWRIGNSIERDADYEIFIRNIAVAGGLLLLVGMGPGSFAMDNRPKGKR